MSTPPKRRTRLIVLLVLIVFVLIVVCCIVAYSNGARSIQDCQDRLGPGGNLTGCQFDDLRGKDLHGANLSSANLRGANLQEADLSGANLKDAMLTSADLTNADLSHADLTWATLYMANLTHANLAGTTLTHADLRRTNLLGADLTGATLDQAKFQGAQGFTLEDLAGWLAVDASSLFKTIEQKEIVLEDKDEVDRLLRSVCDGAQAPGAGAYETGDDIHPFAIVGSTALTQLLEQRGLSVWIPQYLMSTQLVVCVGDDKVEPGGDCQYDKGTLGTKRHYRDVRTISPRDGAAIASEKVYGSAAVCPFSAVIGRGVGSTNIEGEPVTEEDLLQAVLKQVGAAP